MIESADWLFRVKTYYDLDDQIMQCAVVHRKASVYIPFLLWCCRMYKKKEKKWEKARTNYGTANWFGHRILLFAFASW